MKIGDKVAWTSLLGEVMAGEITDIYPSWPASAYVRNVLGTVCGPIELSKLRAATPDDIRNMCNRYTTGLGK